MCSECHAFPLIICLVVSLNKCFFLRKFLSTGEKWCGLGRLLCVPACIALGSVTAFNVRMFCTPPLLKDTQPVIVLLRPV